MTFLEDITMVEFKQKRKHIRTVLLPVGSVEEHGVHLPLGTDTLHAIEISRRVASMRNVWVAPPLWYGLCRSTSDHPGTLGIRGLTLRSIILDLVDSFYHQGMRNVVILSGHAGGTHMAMIVDACEEMVQRYDDLCCAVLSVLDLKNSWNDIVEAPGDSHAGEVETSIIAYMKPELVRGTAPEEYPNFPEFMIVRDKVRFWPGGVWGNPEKASADKGRMLLERSTREVCKVIDCLEGNKD